MLNARIALVWVYGGDVALQDVTIGDNWGPFGIVFAASCESIIT